MRPLYYRVSLAREGAILSRRPLKYEGAPPHGEQSSLIFGPYAVTLRDPEGNLIQFLQHLK